MHLPLSELAVIFIGSGIVVLDTTAVGQILLSQPLISCSLLGLCLGDINTGLYIGLMMELLWLKLVPVGGLLFYEGNIGSFTAAGVAIITLRFNPENYYLIIFCAFLYGFIISYLGGEATMLHRKLAQRIVNRAVTRAKDGRTGPITFGHLGSITINFIGGGIFGTAAIITGIILLPNILKNMPAGWNDYAMLGIMALWGTGIGTVLSMLWEKQKSWAVAFGLFIAALGTIFL